MKESVLSNMEERSISVFIVRGWRDDAKALGFSTSQSSQHKALSHTATMPKQSDEHGLKSRSKKSDKQKRNFELHGSYSQKHIRQQQALHEKTVNRDNAATEEKKRGKT